MVNAFSLVAKLKAALLDLCTRFKLERVEMKKLLKMGTSTLANLAGAQSISVDVVKGEVTIKGGRLDSSNFVKAILKKEIDTDLVLKKDGEYTCVICFCDYPDEEVKILPSCMHAFCLDCLQSFFTNSILSRGPFPITCVGDGCAEILELSNIQACVDSKTYQDLVNASFSSYVACHGDTYNFCPSPDCPQIFLVDSGSFTCDCCGAEICTHCKTIAHEGMTCKEYEVNKDNTSDFLFHKWRISEANVKECPRQGCGAVIEKNGGCNHITCAKCKSHICWLCMELFDQGAPVYDHMAKVHGGMGI